MLKNHFYSKVEKAYLNKVSIDQLEALLGKGRAKKGMFFGDLHDGELEIGQVSSLIDSIQPASLIVEEILKEFNFEKNRIFKL